jgi:nucleoside-diphosphate-sugar epimerase
MSRVSLLIKKKILVTGGGGFIGHHLCRRLCDEGAEVHATSRVQRGEGAAPVWWQADMADIDTARRIIGAIRPDIIFHLAGAVGASPTVDLVLPTYQSLLTSTVNVLITAKEFGCGRIVLTGSFTAPEPGATEPTPHSPYGAAKWAAVAYGRMFHNLYRVPVVILSPFMTYGPGQPMNRLIPSVVSALLRGESPKLTSGRVRFDWVYIADVIEGFVATSTASRIEGRTIELGSGHLVSVRDVVERLYELIGTKVKPLFGALPDRPGENEIAANTDVALELLNWRATTSLNDGLAQSIEWFKANRTKNGSNFSTN